jgi:hypothetical protein
MRFSTLTISALTRLCALNLSCSDGADAPSAPRELLGRDADESIEPALERARGAAARAGSQLAQPAISLRAPVPVELPHVPDLANLIQIQLGGDQLVPVP